MAQRTENNYLIPQADDGPSTLIDILRQNFRRWARHTHDGSDSSPLGQETLVNFVQEVSPDWGTIDAETDLYTTTIGVPDSSGVDLRRRTPNFFDADGNRLYLDYAIISETEITIRSNEDFADLTIHYA